MNSFAKFLTKFKILPVLLLLAALAFGVRFSDFVKDIGRSAAPQPAVAAEPVEPVPVGTVEREELALDPVTTPPPSADGVLADPAAQFGEGSEEIELPSGDDEGEIEWRDSLDSDFEYSEVRMKLFEDLTARRKDLEKQERELAMREALLTAAEQELEQKYQELQSLKAEIEELLVKQSEEEEYRIASLVKIYEGMKPKDAARIFNTLEMDVLLQVVGKMSERKSAPILASMEPERARSLTIKLMEQKALPDVSDPMLKQ